MRSGAADDIPPGNASSASAQIAASEKECSEGQQLEKIRAGGAANRARGIPAGRRRNERSERLRGHVSIMVMRLTSRPCR